MGEEKHDEGVTQAEILREYGPFEDADHIGGVTFDGRRVWFAAGNRMQSFEPGSGAAGRALDIACDAGTAFDGKHLFQLASGCIHKIDPDSGKILSSIPAPGGGRDSGLAWAEGTLWVGQYPDRKIHQIDPDSGAILRTIESDRFVTGVTWSGGELWHGTWEGGVSEIRQIDPRAGQVLARLALPAGAKVSGLESDGDVFYAGGEGARVRAVRKPKRR